MDTRSILAVAVLNCTHGYSTHTHTHTRTDGQTEKDEHAQRAKGALRPGGRDGEGEGDGGDRGGGGDEAPRVRSRRSAHQQCNVASQIEGFRRVSVPADAAGDVGGATERDVERDEVGIDKRSHVGIVRGARAHGPKTCRCDVATHTPTAQAIKDGGASQQQLALDMLVAKSEGDGADDVALLFEQLVDGVDRGHPLPHGVREEHGCRRHEGEGKRDGGSYRGAESDACPPHIL